jgi:aminomuconate-semialdehyde/2-hydroxymuconate-6-semialdehyde dehydrogenase
MSLNLCQSIEGKKSESQGLQRQFRSPWNQEILAEWRDADEMDVIRCLQSSKKFLALPAGWPREERLALLERLKAAVEKIADAGALQEAETQGLPKSFVLENSFYFSIRLLEKNIEALKTTASSGYLHSPSGVVAAISAWCLSFRLVMETLVPAWAAGNSVIIKISSRSPTTAQILQNLMAEIEAPPGSVHILLGEGAKVGAFLAAHPGVRAVSFVGQSKNAESVIKATAAQFKKLRVRGGTKNAAMILPGFDSEKYLSQVLESFLIGQGQTGWSMTRLLTTEAEAEKLSEGLKKKLLELRPAQGPEDPSPWGPLRSPEIQTQLVKKAMQEHAKKLLPDFNGPTFLLDLPNCSDLQQEELQAPVFPIVTVKYLHELSKWANNTSYGQLAVLWGDENKARKVCEKLEFGGMWLNHWMRAQDQSPWGLKQSAFGIPDDLAEGPFYSDRKLTI